MNNFTKSTYQDYNFNTTNLIPFEEDYEKIKDDPAVIFEKYYSQIEKTFGKIAYQKGIPKEELVQETYEYFLKFCDRYDPYYQGNFVKFDDYVFKNMIMSVRAGIQKHYLTQDREKATDSDEMPEKGSSNDMYNTTNKLLVNQLYDYLTDLQRQVLELYSKGYKQKEIGEILGISQSRISCVFKHALKTLRKILNEQKILD